MLFLSSSSGHWAVNECDMLHLWTATLNDDVRPFNALFLWRQSWKWPCVNGRAKSYKELRALGRCTGIGAQSPESTADFA